MSELPIVDENGYTWNDLSPGSAWLAGRLHWIAVGRARGNAGRIQLAGDPYNPSAERLINGMEAIIELARRLALLDDASAPEPQSPREAIEQYFKLPRLDMIPRTKDKEQRRRSEEHTSELQSPDHLVCRLLLEKKKRTRTVT